MKKTCLLFLSAILHLSTSSQNWVQLADFPGPERDDGVAFVIGNKAYCGTGLQVGWSLGRDFYYLDLTNDVWVTMPWMPIGAERQYACGFTNGINGYVFGGEAYGTDLKDLWMYSPTTNSWTAKTPKPGNGVRGASCFVIGDTAYIVGGATGTINAINEVWAYIFSSDTWIQKNNAPFTIWRAAAANYGNTGALIFGRDVNGAFRKELYYYFPQTDTWQLEKIFPGNGRAYATAQTLNTTNMHLYIYCGYDSLNYYYNELHDFYGPIGIFYSQNAIPGVGRKGGMGFTWMTNTYYVCGINQSNIRLKETWKADQYVGIKELEKETDLDIFPNPASEYVLLRYSGSVLKGKIYRIYNSLGTEVLSGMLDNDHRIEVNSLTKGIYQLVISGFATQLIIQ